MEKNRRKNNHFAFILLLLLSLPLIFFFSYYTTSIFANIPNPPKEESKLISISDITKPNYSLTPLVIDTDLPKFPSDYDNLVNTLGISLTQHQKTTLLLYGESLSKTTQTNITDAYKELIEKNIPILIPQEYINEYLNNEFEIKKLKLESIPEEINNGISIVKESFSNPYQEYIFKQLNTTLQYNIDTNKVDINTYPTLGDFLINPDSESINYSYYVERVLKAFLKENDSENITELLNSIVTYSQAPDINTKNKLNTQLKNVVFNPKLNKEGQVYWNISVVNGKSYVFPIYISEDFLVNDNNFNDPYDVEPLAQSRNSVRVPILMYHRIEALPTNASSFTTGLYVSPEIFEQQLAYMVKKNYKSVTSQQFYNILQSGKNPTQKSVMITFDDGTKGQYINGYPLLKKYGLVGVFYIPSAKTSITYNQLREMAQGGMIIESHSATHIDLAKETNSDRLYSEIVGSRYALRSATGQEVITISYPGCVADKDVYPYVTQAGYLLGGSCGRGIDHYFSKRLSLQRVHVFDNVDNLKNILSGKP